MALHRRKERTPLARQVPPVLRADARRHHTLLVQGGEQGDGDRLRSVLSAGQNVTQPQGARFGESVHLR